MSKNNKDILEWLLDEDHKEHWYVSIWHWILHKLDKLHPREIKWIWQRMSRGFSDKDLWSLDYTIGDFILPR